MKNDFKALPVKFNFMERNLNDEIADGTLIFKRVPFIEQLNL
jgi:hypothetical protein